MHVMIPLPYGKLKLVSESPPPAVFDVLDPTALFPVGLPQYHFEYEGRVTKKQAIELASALSGHEVLVNNMPLAKFLESVSAY